MVAVHSSWANEACRLLPVVIRCANTRSLSLVNSSTAGASDSFSLQHFISIRFDSSIICLSIFWLFMLLLLMMITSFSSRSRAHLATLYHNDHCIIQRALALFFTSFGLDSPKWPWLFFFLTSWNRRTIMITMITLMMIGIGIGVELSKSPYRFSLIPDISSMAALSPAVWDPLHF